jgi:hypothetical protein
MFVSQIESFRNFKLHAKDKAACQRVDISQNGARHLSLSPPTERLLCTVIADPVLALHAYLQPVHSVHGIRYSDEQFA